MVWDQNDQISANEWQSAQSFFSSDKGAPIYLCLDPNEQVQHVFVRTEDGAIYGINHQDSQKIQGEVNDKKQWPPSVLAKNVDNKLVTLALVKTLMKTQYKVATPTAEGVPDEKKSAGGWKGAFSGISSLAGETMQKASAQISKTTKELGDAAEKGDWKSKIGEMRHKAESAVEKAGSQIGKASSEIGKVTDLKSKASPEEQGLAAVKRLHHQLAQLKHDAQTIRSLADPKRVEQYKQLSDALDVLIQKLDALFPPSEK